MPRRAIAIAPPACASPTATRSCSTASTCDVAEGTVFALLGPNGAGKTTTVQILSTLIAADAGEVRVAGHDLAREPDAVRAAIGVTGQFSAVDNLLTGEENLILMADLHHLGRARGPAARRRAARPLRPGRGGRRKPAATYSGGMRRRLDLAMTLVGDPRIIFLDEPTTGLDPRSRRTMWQIIRELVAGRRHHLPHHAVPGGGRPARRPDRRPRPRPAGRRGHRGRAQAARSPAATSGCGSPTRTRSTRPPRAFGAAARDDEALTLQVPSDGGVRSLRAVLDRLDDARSTSPSLTVHTPDLDDVFLALTGHADDSPKEPVR